MKGSKGLAIAFVLLLSLVILGCNAVQEILGTQISISGSVLLDSEVKSVGKTLYVGLTGNTFAAPSSVGSWDKYEPLTILPGGSGTFSFSQVTPGKYIVAAFYDLDDDATYDQGEPSGSYPSNGTLRYDFTEGKSGLSITVNAVPLTDQQAVDADLAALQIGYASGDSATQVTSNLTLPASGENGSTVAWVSGNSGIISNSGLVTRPAAKTDVTLYAMLQKGAVSASKTFTLSVLSSVLTASEAIAVDKSALAIGFSGGDSATSVTSNLSLPTAGANGTSIAWNSSAPDVVSTAGLVTRAAQASTVILVATITKSGAQDSKSFTLNVLASTLTDRQAVDAAAGALAVTFAAGDSASSVTSNLILPTSGPNGTTVAWTSSAAAVVSAAGAVTRPSATNATVYLTAVVTKGSATATKIFTLTILKAVLDDAESVAADKTALAVGYASGDSAASVTQDLTLATSGSSGSVIAWTSNPEGIVGATGTVARPASTTVVTLTAAISKGASSDSKIFSVTVIKAALPDDQAVAADAAELAPGFAVGDSVASVTSNLALPSSGSNGSAISWASSDVAVITATGLVTRPAAATDVILTATIVKGSATATKTFTVTVLKSAAQMTDAEIVAADKAALALGFSGSDNDQGVTGSISLPTSGASGSAISWASSDAAIVSAAGVVARPAATTAVTLTATIAKGSASDTKAFTVSVLLALPATPTDLAVGAELFSPAHSWALTWTSVAGAERYEVYRNGTSRYNDTTVGFTDNYDPLDATTGLAYGTTYSYQIRAINAAGSSALSAAVSATTLKLAPPNFVATAASTTSIALSWTPIKGSISYQVYRDSSQTGTFTTSAYSGTASGFTDVNLASGTTYWYKLKATYPAGASELSAAISCATAQAGTVATPTFTPAAGSYQSAQTVTIATTTPDATIYYSTNGIDPDKSSAVYSAPISVSATTTIKAFASASGMTSSAITSATYSIQLTPNAPSITASPHATLKKVTIAITAPASGPAPTSYNIYRGTSSGGQGTTPIATGVTALSWEDTTILPAGPNTYYYKVSGVNASGEGLLSAEKVATGVVPPTPTNLAVAGTAGMNAFLVLARYNDAYQLYASGSGLFTMSSTNATGVFVERSADSGSTWTTVYSGPGIVNYYRDEGPYEAASTLKWRAKNYNGWGSSGYSNIISYTFPAKLAASSSVSVAISGTGSPKTVTITWNSVTNADTYYIYRRAATSDPWTLVAGGSQISSPYAKALSPTNSNYTFYYAVVGIDGATPYANGATMQAGTIKATTVMYNNQ